MMRVLSLVAACLTLAAVPALRAQARPQPPAGQAAFAAIADVVRQLEADPTTDWSTVNIEALRQHLIDMNDVVLRSAVTMDTIPGGARFVVRGTGRTAEAIRRMSQEHAGMLTMDGAFSAVVEPRADGVTFTVSVRSVTPAAVARLRGLGFIGLLTIGEHHAMHHLMLARGMAMHHPGLH